MARKAKRAKKAKSAKRAAKKAARSTARNIPLDTVVAFVQWLEANGHTREFLQTHGKRVVALSAPSFQRVRTFVGQKQPPAEAAATAAGAGPPLRACPPGFRCF